MINSIEFSFKRDDDFEKGSVCVTTDIRMEKRKKKYRYRFLTALCDEKKLSAYEILEFCFNSVLKQYKEEIEK